MNARARLFAALDGRPVDRTPVWLLFPYHSCSYYVDVRTHPAYRPVFEASKRYAVMLDRRGFSVPLFSGEVVQRRESFRDGAERVSRSVIEYKGRRLVAEMRRSSFGSRVKKLLETDADLEFYCSLPINDDASRIHAHMDELLPNYIREREEFPMEFGSMMVELGEPIQALYDVSKLDEYPIWSLTHNDMIVDFLNRVMNQKRVMYQYCLDRRLADVFFLVGSELASPPMLRRGTFQQWIVPYASELIAMIHTSGAKAIQHYHGQIRDILPDFMEMGADGLHTIEAPPIGNCTLSEAYDIIGDTITLIGNIQYDDFRSLTELQMADAVRAVLDEAAGRRFILSPTAGPYDEDVPENVIRNYGVFMETAWRYGRTPIRR